MSKPLRAFVFLGLGFVAASAIACGAPSGEGAAVASTAPISASEAGPRAKEILEQSQPLTRIADLGGRLHRCGPDADPALLEAFENAPLDGGDPELIVLATWWSKFDPKAAFEWTSSDWRATYGAVIAAVFRGWAHQDPQAALKAAGTIRFQG